MCLSSSSFSQRAPSWSQTFPCWVSRPVPQSTGAYAVSLECLSVLLSLPWELVQVLQCNPITLKTAFKNPLLQMRYFRAPRPQLRAQRSFPAPQLQLFSCPGQRWWQRLFEGWGCSNTWITFSVCKFSSGKNESYFSYALLEYLPFKCLWRIFRRPQSEPKYGESWIYLC